MQRTPLSTKSVITANKSSKKLTLIRCANLKTKTNRPGGLEFNHTFCSITPHHAFRSYTLAIKLILATKLTMLHFEEHNDVFRIREEDENKQRKKIHNSKYHRISSNNKSRPASVASYSTRPVNKTS